MTLGSMEEKTIVETADSFGSPITQKPQFIYKNRLDKNKIYPSHLSLHGI